MPISSSIVPTVRRLYEHFCSIAQNDNFAKYVVENHERNNTFNFKSKANSREASQVKIEMIIYRPGYARVPKVTTITGLAKDWDEKSQLFRSKSHEATEKNKALAEMPCANLRKGSTAGSFLLISSTR